jgi:putative sterol carrier protein
VSAFLSAEWFAGLDESLKSAGPPPFDDGAVDVRIVFELTDAPPSLPHAITFAVTHDEVTVRIGDHLAADALIRISYEDAAKLANGTLTSAEAVRDGRLKIRGDVHGLVPLLGWLLNAADL